VTVNGHIIQGAVDRVEHPHAAAPRVDRVPLLPQQWIPGGGQALSDECLDAAVDLSDHIIAVAFGVDAQFLARVEGEKRPRADGLKGGGKQPVRSGRVCIMNGGGVL
jgi:hypothetical protein